MSQQEIETKLKYNQNRNNTYNIKINYSKIVEQIQEDLFDKYLYHLLAKIKSTTFTSLLQINLSKNGILCQDNCSNLQQILSNVFDQNEQCNVEFEIDLKKMLEAGGIHYYLSKQLAITNTHFQVTHLTIKLTKELFNSQCLGVLSNSLKEFKQIKVFHFLSQIKLDQVGILQSIPQNIIELKLQLVDPQNKSIFPYLLNFKSLKLLELILNDCDIQMQDELYQYINITKINQLSLGLHFKECILIRKDEFYNSLSNCIKLLNTKKIQLQSYSIDLSQVEDSGLKQDILQELSNGLIATTLKKLNIIFRYETHIKTILISHLYKLSSLLSKLDKLDSLILQMNIPHKYFDILQESLNKNLWKLKQFEFIDTTQQKQSLDIHIQNENNSTLTRLKGLKVRNNLQNLKYLLSYSESSTLSNTDKASIKIIDKTEIENDIKQQYLFLKRKLVQQLFSIQISSLFKRKEMKEDLLIQFLI